MKEGGGGARMEKFCERSVFKTKNNFMKGPVDKFCEVPAIQIKKFVKNLVLGKKIMKRTQIHPK